MKLYSILLLTTVAHGYLNWGLFLLAYQVLVLRLLILIFYPVHCKLVYLALS